MNLPAPVLATTNQSMLLVLPLPFLARDGRLFVESQAANGLRKWSAHFDDITLAAPVLPPGDEDTVSIHEWVPASSIRCLGRLRTVCLPWGYGWQNHFGHLAAVRKVLKKCIDEHRYLQFAIGGCTHGDWAAVAARIARSAQRPYAVHTDWVTHGVIVDSVEHGIKKLRARLESFQMRFAERRVIKGSAIGLFHGADTFDAYEPWCEHPQLIHDVHVGLKEIPTEEQVAHKANSIRSGSVLSIVYAGRAVAMKGPFDWVETMAALNESGVNFNATWYGDGPDLVAMRKMVVQRGLTKKVFLPGKADHSMILKHLRESDILVFCHLTPESPRILIEALNQATPIVGFHSSYPADLTAGGGGIFAKIGDPHALASEIAAIESERSRLADLVHSAAVVGRELTDDAVFKHRSDLIKRYLP